jgi:hypothetical protein
MGGKTPRATVWKLMGIGSVPALALNGKKYFIVGGLTWKNN